MNFKEIKVEIYNQTGVICLNRPENLNIIEKDTFDEITRAINIFEKEKKIKIICIKSKCGISKLGQKIFSAGVNLKQYEEKFKLFDENPEEFKKNLQKQKTLLTKIENFKKPVIIAIEGFVCGGFFELALACDIILAAKSARFKLNEVNVGLIPGYGGISRLLNIVGKNKAFQIAAVGREISAKEACSLNIVSEVFEDDIFEEKTMDFCKNLEEKSSNSLFLIKNTINMLLNNSRTEEIETGNFLEAIKSNDSREGVRAFIEKRKPVF